MNWRFWKREKKIEDAFLRDENTLASNEIESMDLVHKDSINKQYTDDDASDDSIFGNFAKDNPCKGKLKSGLQCSRIVDTPYCWQHKNKGDE